MNVQVTLASLREQRDASDRAVEIAIRVERAVALSFLAVPHAPAYAMDELDLSMSISARLDKILLSDEEREAKATAASELLGQLAQLGIGCGGHQLPTVPAPVLYPLDTMSAILETTAADLAALKVEFAAR